MESSIYAYLISYLTPILSLDPFENKTAAPESYGSGAFLLC